MLPLRISVSVKGFLFPPLCVTWLSHLILQRIYSVLKFIHSITEICFPCLIYISWWSVETLYIGSVGHSNLLAGWWYDGLHNLYSWPNIIRMIKSRGLKWTAYVVHMQNVSLKTPRMTWIWMGEYYYNTSERNRVWGCGLDVLGCRHDQHVLVNTIMKVGVSKRTEKFLAIWWPVSFLKRILLHVGACICWYGPGNKVLELNSSFVVWTAL
jgi:hypothetical protein